MNLLNSLTLAEAQRSLWMPKSASTVADGVDAIYYFILYLSAFFFVGIVGAMVYFMVKYRRKEEGQRTSPVKDHHKLEIWWSVLPSILLVVMFVWGFKQWMKMNIPPDNALEVRVMANQWNWSFNYNKHGIYGESDLIVPVDTPIKLIMSSSDVLHSFFVPEFRVKKDVVPGRYQVVWFEATEVNATLKDVLDEVRTRAKVGQRKGYNLLCAEYCGKDHSRMITRVKVLSKKDYADWVARGGSIEWPAENDAERPKKLAKIGKLLFDRNGCGQCHSMSGGQNTGPALDGIFGKKELCEDGNEYLVDENYLRESILLPAAKVVKGFEPKMPSFKGKIEETAKGRPSQIDALIEFLKDPSAAEDK